MFREGTVKFLNFGISVVGEPENQFKHAVFYERYEAEKQNDQFQDYAVSQRSDLPIPRGIIKK